MGQGIYDGPGGAPRGRHGEAVATLIRRGIPQAGQGDDFALEVVGRLQVKGIPGALQYKMSLAIKQDLVDCDGGIRGQGHYVEEESAGSANVCIGGGALAADMVPELMLNDAVEVTLHGDLGVREWLPLECPIHKRSLDGACRQLVGLDEVMEDGAVTAKAMGAAAGKIGPSGRFVVGVVKAHLQVERQARSRIAERAVQGGGGERGRPTGWHKRPRGPQAGGPLD